MKQNILCENESYKFFILFANIKENTFLIMSTLILINELYVNTS